jgi:hypothetical protein
LSNKEILVTGLLFVIGAIFGMIAYSALLLAVVGTEFLGISLRIVTEPMRFGSWLWSLGFGAIAALSYLVRITLTRD